MADSSGPVALPSHDPGSIAPQESSTPVRRGRASASTPNSSSSSLYRLTKAPSRPTITIDNTATLSSDHHPTASLGPGSNQSSSGLPATWISSSLGATSSVTAVDSTSDSRPTSRAGSVQSGDDTSRPDLDSNHQRSHHNMSTPVTNRGERALTFLSVPGSGPHAHPNSPDTDDSSQAAASSPQSDRLETESFIDPATGERSLSPPIVTSKDIIHDRDALQPAAPKDAASFNVDQNPFAFTPGQLGRMFDPKSLAAFWALGGLHGIGRGLRTDRKAGLSVDETSLYGSITFDAATRHNHSPLATKPASSPPSPSTSSPDLSRPDQGPERISSTPSAHTSVHTPAEPSAEHFKDRLRVFSDNRLPEKKGKTMLQLMWITYNDRVLILLSVAAAISLAIGLYQTFTPDRNGDHSRIEWVEGVAIVTAILIVVFVGSFNDYQKERQFAKLNRKKQDRKVKVTRSGRAREISVYDLLVGDVIHLEPGDLIPVDGVLIDGFNVKCDESQATGESDIIRKQPGDLVFAAIQDDQNLSKLDPFIQSGARVMEGVGTYMATSTGIHSTYGKIIMSLNEDPEMTPLQSKLNIVAEYIAKLGGAAGLVMFIVLFIQFLVRLPSLGPEFTPADKGQLFLKIFIVVITIIVVAVPEGLPLAVTLALAFATTRMLKDNNLVRHLKACEVMGNATSICSDKTGTLTQNKMQIVAGTIGTSASFGDLPNDRPSVPAGANLPPSPSSQTSSTSTTATTPDPSSQSSTLDKNKTPNQSYQDSTPVSTQTAIIDSSPVQFAASLCPDVRSLVKDSIALNSTAFEGEIDAESTFIGSKTETALLLFARDHLGMGPVAEERENAKTLQIFPFDSRRKCMGVVVRTEGGRARLYVKGASEVMVARCGYVLDRPTVDCSTIQLPDAGQETVRSLIESYGSQSLRTIGLIYKDLESWPPRSMRRQGLDRSSGSAARGDRDESQIDLNDVMYGMTFIGLVGIQDPLRDGVKEAVSQCQWAGVTVRMVTGDNKLTALAIARDCGILQSDSLVLEGLEFRRMNSEKQRQAAPKLHVMARSSPDDKRMLVECLKSLGETVAVTGDGTNDAPALRTADIGFSMGVTGTEVAKEASDIILMDDNFASIVLALKWGRAVNDAVKRFLQFQLTVNITAVMLTFITAVSDAQETSVLTAVQLLWVNLIMDTLAALALATDPPSDRSLDRKPERRNASIISLTMWKMIIGQSIYQLTVTLVLYYRSADIIHALGGGMPSGSQIKTLVFNTFVWMQIFNQWNNRQLDNHLNIFEGVLRNWFFLAVSVIMCGGQLVILFFGGAVFSIAPQGQSATMWAIALVLGATSLLVGIVIRLVPDQAIQAMVPSILQRRRGHDRNGKAPGLTVMDEERLEFFPFPLTTVRDELAFLKRIKGGRLNNLRFAMRQTREHLLHRSRSPSFHSNPQSGSTHPNPSSPRPEWEDSSGSSAGTHESRHRSWSVRSRSNSALGAPTVMAGLVAAGVAAAWNPSRMQPRKDDEPAKNNNLPAEEAVELV